MFTQDRDQLRRYYLNCWQKQQSGATLDALEQQVAEVIAEHPEYHALLQDEDKALGREYAPEDGETNPFLHVSLHLGLQEQVVTDRPAGIRELYQQMLTRHGVHEAEHQMMQYLIESLWVAQRNQSAPDEKVYMEGLRGLLKT